MTTSMPVTRITASHANVMLDADLDADRERLLDRLLPATVPPERVPPPPPPRPRVRVVRRPAAPAAPARTARRTPPDDGLVDLDVALRMTGQTQHFVREPR